MSILSLQSIFIILTISVVTFDLVNSVFEIWSKLKILSILKVFLSILLIQSTLELDMSNVTFLSILTYNVGLKLQKDKQCHRIIFTFCFTAGILSSVPHKSAIRRIRTFHLSPQSCVRHHDVKVFLLAIQNPSKAKSRCHETLWNQTEQKIRRSHRDQTNQRIKKTFPLTNNLIIFNYFRFYTNANLKNLRENSDTTY